ncbi:SCP2 domain-containing protein [Rouxiella sp. WC2420]|uniref:Ubiquinone biosynthesis accessory factor UbiT n=1 Tax=Rouxiella sp. WC2420 TaxID=3234145 RepID=A0AB39VTV1_9GAMM
MLQKLRAQVVSQGPSLLSVPLRFTPFALKRQLLEQVLGWQFRQALADGDLAFLEGRWLGIEISDLSLYWLMTVENGKLRVCEQGEADVSFIGNANDLLLVAARKEDPDTLFFKRRLRIEGDTELGLNVKNLMDSIEPENMPVLLREGLNRLAAFIYAANSETANSAARHCKADRQEDGESFSPAAISC